MVPWNCRICPDPSPQSGREDSPCRSANCSRRLPCCSRLRWRSGCSLTGAQEGMVTCRHVAMPGDRQRFRSHSSVDGVLAPVVRKTASLVRMTVRDGSGGDGMEPALTPILFVRCGTVQLKIATYGACGGFRRDCGCHGVPLFPAASGTGFGSFRRQFSMRKRLVEMIPRQSSTWRGPRYTIGAGNVPPVLWR